SPTWNEKISFTLERGGEMMSVVSRCIATRSRTSMPATLRSELAWIFRSTTPPVVALSGASSLTTGAPMALPSSPKRLLPSHAPSTAARARGNSAATRRRRADRSGRRVKSLMSIDVSPRDSLVARTNDLGGDHDEEVLLAQIFPRGAEQTAQHGEIHQHGDAGTRLRTGRDRQSTDDAGLAVVEEDLGPSLLLVEVHADVGG